MNSTVYLFGDFSQGYSQYPNDYAQSIFQNFYARSNAKTQIVIHRKNELMYYGYIHKLDTDASTPQYIGMCVLLNGIMLKNIKALFSLFENTFTDLVVNGVLLEFNDKGDVITKVNQLYEKQNEVDRITNLLHNAMSQFDNDCVKLPPVSYGISVTDVKDFTDTDDDNDIMDAASKYGYTFIFKNKDYNTRSLSGYKEIIRRLNREKEEITKNFNKLSSEYQKVLRQKKQFKVIIFLCIAIVIFIVAGSSMLSSKETAISDLENKVSNLKNDISEKVTTISTLQNSLSSAISAKEEVEQRYSCISDQIPILITNMELGNINSNGDVVTSYGSTIYSNNTMYLQLRITYTGINTGKDIRLYIKLYTPDGTLSTCSSSPYGYSFSSDLNVISGEKNITTLTSWGSATPGQWGSGSYRFEIWYDNVCLKAKSFTIYDY